MSYWTKRRKVNTQLNLHLQNIANSYLAAGDNIGINSSSTAAPNVADNGSRNSDFEASFTSDQEAHEVHNISTVDADQSDSESDIDSNSGSSVDVDEHDLQTLLTEWAIEHEITHTALRSLLTILTKLCYEYVGKMTFPDIDAPLRTDVSFDEMRDEEHHIGQPPLQGLSLGMVSQFPLDYMHLVCLGVVKRLLQIWMQGPLKVRLGSQIKRQISEALLRLRPFMPKEFARKPRSLSEKDRWKATEFRLFLLYTGPLVLCGRIAKEMYQNFLLLSVGIHILANPCLCHEMGDFANDLLVMFVQHFSQLYGADMLVYNVHCLIHLAADVKKHGPVDSFSAFPFENFLCQLKHLVRKPSFMLEQVILRLSERSRMAPIPNSKRDRYCLKKPHYRGPLPSDTAYLPCTQYQKVVLKDFIITNTKGDNCVRIGQSIAIVKNIVQCQLGIFIMYKVFSCGNDFFHYPLDSRRLDVHKVSLTDLSDDVLIANIETVVSKYVLLPHQDMTYVALPLMHTITP